MDTIQRGDKENLQESRVQEVSDLVKAVNEDLGHWQYAFDRMKAWRKFARGLQWHKASKEQGADPDRAYVLERYRELF